MPATTPIPTLPSNALYESEPSRQQQQQHQHDVAPHQQRGRSASVTAPTDSAAFAARKQWEAKLVSLQRGMEHVQHCRAGDACGSSLCHSTRRLMQTYENHQCPPPPSSTAGAANPNANPNPNPSVRADCKVCKLWDLVMTRRTQMATIAHMRRPLVRATSSSSSSATSSAASGATPSTCSIAALVGPRRSAAASVFSRVVAAQKEAHHLSARRRF